MSGLTHLLFVWFNEQDQYCTLLLPKICVQATVSQRKV